MLQSNSSKEKKNNINFIADVFKCRFNNETTIHHCMNRRLDNRDEESLECLRELFRLICLDLERVTGVKVMDCYFNQMHLFILQEKYV